MRTRLLLSAGELVLGLIVGYLTYQLSGDQDAVTGILSLAVGLLTSLLASNLSQHFLEDARQRRAEERLELLISRVSDRLLSSADVAGALRYGGVEIARGEATRVWLDRIWRTSSRYWGVVYTAPGEVVDTSIFQLGAAVLSAKSRVDQVDVRRIFIVDDQAELEHVLPAIRAPHDSQIKVRYALRATLEAHPLLKAQLRQLPTLDFTVMDATVVWMLLLDRGRRIKSAMLYFDEAMNARYAEVYRLMWDAATPVESAPAKGMATSS